MLQSMGSQRVGQDLQLNNNNNNLNHKQGRFSSKKQKLEILKIKLCDLTAFMQQVFTVPDNIT